MATLLAVEFARLSHALLNGDMDLKERWACLGDIQRRLSRLRRDDHYAGTLALKRERWTRQVVAEETAAATAADKEERRQHVTRYRFLRGGILDMEAKTYGGDDIGHDIAAMSLEEEHNLDFGRLGRKSDYFALRTDPDEPIYPWRRRRSKAAGTPSEGRVPRVPNTPDAPDPGRPTQDPTTVPQTPDAEPVTPSTAPIPLANDLPPQGSIDEDPASVNPPSGTPPSGQSHCRPPRSSSTSGDRRQSPDAFAKPRQMPVNVTKCNL